MNTTHTPTMTTTRTITFTDGQGNITVAPAGTVVYAHRITSGRYDYLGGGDWYRIRMPWTLWRQDVNAASVRA